LRKSSERDRSPVAARGSRFDFGRSGRTDGGEGAADGDRPRSVPVAALPGSAAPRPLQFPGMLEVLRSAPTVDSEIGAPNQTGGPLPARLF